MNSLRFWHTKQIYREINNQKKSINNKCRSLFLKWKYGIFKSQSKFNMVWCLLEVQVKKENSLLLKFGNKMLINQLWLLKKLLNSNMKIWFREIKEKQNKDKPTKLILTVINNKLTIDRRKKLVLGMIGKMLMKKEQEIVEEDDLLPLHK